MTAAEDTGPPSVQSASSKHLKLPPDLDLRRRAKRLPNPSEDDDTEGEILRLQNDDNIFLGNIAVAKE